MRNLLIPLFVLVGMVHLPTSIVADMSESPTSRTQLQGLVAEALENNAELKAEQARWRASENKIVQAGSLNDPQLAIAFNNYPIDSLSDDETPMTGKDIRLTQAFPFPGKLKTKREIAEAQTLWNRHAYEDARLKLAARVKNGYYQIFYFDRAIAMTEKNLELIGDFTRVVESRYAVGKGLQADILKAQVEQSKMLDGLLDLRQKRRTALANLNYLLNRDPATPLEPIDDVTPDVVSVPLVKLQKLSEDRRPLYEAYRALIDQFTAQRKLAKLDYRPDFTLWGGYRLRENVPGDPVQGEDFVSAGISMNLPIYAAKRSGAVAEANELINMARQKFDNFRRQTYFNIEDDYVQMEKNRDLIDLFKTGIIPQAEQTYRATLAAYQVDKVDFLSLVDSLMKLYRYQINYYKALSDHQRNVADLEADSGVDVAGVPE